MTAIFGDWDNPARFSITLLRNYEKHVPVFSWCSVCLEALAEPDSILCLACIYDKQRRAR